MNNIKKLTKIVRYLKYSILKIKKKPDEINHRAIINLKKYYFEIETLLVDLA